MYPDNVISFTQIKLMKTELKSKLDIRRSKPTVVMGKIKFVNQKLVILIKVEFFIQNESDSFGYAWFD